MNATEFADALRVRVPKVIEARAGRVYFDAVTQLYEAIARATPVDTGFMRAGLQATPVGASPVVPEKRPETTGGSTKRLRSQYTNVKRAGMVGFKGLAPIVVGFVAEYAQYVERRVGMLAQARARWREFNEVAVRNTLSSAADTVRARGSRR